MTLHSLESTARTDRSTEAFFYFFNEAPTPRLSNRIRSRETWSPPVDVSETADGYTFAIELPGMTPETVEVEVKDNALTVKGERKEAT